MIGHNPKASQNQSDDYGDIVALMKELPRVSAPTNFNASLQARIATAKTEASEFADVTSLIKELPRVAAPADFDFKLRARLAQVKAEQQKTSPGWFSELFGLSFSWTQAGMAMAVVAVTVSVVAFGILRSNNSVQPAIDKAPIARSTQPVSPVADLSVAQTPPSQVEVKKPESLTLAVKNSLAGSSKIKPTQAVHTPTLLPPTPKKASATLQPDDEGLMAARTVIIKHRSGEARVVNLSEYNLGLQTANVRTAPASKPADATFAANIY